MQRASPMMLRQSLILVENFKKAGIDFVPLPVLKDGEKAELLADMQQRIDAIANKVQNKD